MDELTAIPMAQFQQRIQYAVKDYGSSLFKFIRSMVSSNEDAEDILQDVWYKLMSVMDTEPIEQLSAWLYKVSRNTILDRKRKQKTLALEDFIYENEDGELHYPDNLLTDHINPHLLVENENFREKFFAALAELPDKQREVYVKHELDDISLQEIADSSGESIKTIISRKHYAVVHLRKRLEELYKD